MTRPHDRADPLLGVRDRGARARFDQDPEQRRVVEQRLCRRHGALFVADEIQTGLGRTGRMWAVEHWGVEPDVLLSAKALSGGFAPVGAVALRRDVFDAVFSNMVRAPIHGSTFSKNNLAMAAGIATLDVIEDEGLVENAARMQSVMRSEMDRLAAKHPCVKEGRALGLFGMIDLQKNSAGEPMAGYNSSTEPMRRLNAFFRDAGLFTYVRWGSFMCNPPLCITEEQLLDAFAIVDRGLDITDAAFEG